MLKFKETRTTEDKPRCGRPRNIRTDASMQRDAASVADNSKTSTSIQCFQLGMTRSSLWNILVKDLKYHPYKIQIKRVTVHGIPKAVCYSKRIIRNVKVNFSTQINFSFWGRTVAASISRSESSWFLSLGKLERKSLHWNAWYHKGIKTKHHSGNKQYTPETLSKVMNSAVKRAHCCLTQ